MDDRSPIRVLIVLRDRILRDALADGISRHTALDVVQRSCANDPCLIHEEIESHSVDIVVIHSDSLFEPVSQCVRTLTRFKHQARIVVTGLEDSGDEILAVIEAGASGIATSHTSLEELASNIEAVANGSTLCSPQVASLLFSRVAEGRGDIHGNTGKRRHRITRREREIIGLIERGLTNKAIASELCIEVQTVKNHVHNVLEKLDLKRRTEVARYARNVGWMDTGYSTRSSTSRRTADH